MSRTTLTMLAAALWLAGCAGAPVSEEPKKLKPLPSYAADPFVPVNLYMNANEQVEGTLADLIQYSADQLRDSGAFVRVDRGVQRWPITIQARYKLQKDTGAGDSTRRVLAYLTLGLVPLRVAQTHTLFVEVLTEPESVAALELSVTVPDELSLYAMGDAKRSRAAADDLLERLMTEIAQRKLIPRWSAFKPDTRKKPEVKAERQAT